MKRDRGLRHWAAARALRPTDSGRRPDALRRDGLSGTRERGDAALFTLPGLRQLAQRRSVRRVGADIPALGAFYGLAAGTYLFFEAFPANFRPVLIDGWLEAAYPSSTTLLPLGVMGAAIEQARRRVRRASLRRTAVWGCAAFAALTVTRRARVYTGRATSAAYCRARDSWRRDGCALRGGAAENTQKENDPTGAVARVGSSFYGLFTTGRGRRRRPRGRP